MLSWVNNLKKIWIWTINTHSDLTILQCCNTILLYYNNIQNWQYYNIKNLERGKSIIIKLVNIFSRITGNNWTALSYFLSFFLLDYLFMLFSMPWSQNKTLSSSQWYDNTEFLARCVKGQCIISVLIKCPHFLSVKVLVNIYLLVGRQFDCIYFSNASAFLNEILIFLVLKF